MLEWLFSPIDPTRTHAVGFAISWHARSMVLGWGIIAPLAVIVARFFKITPKQDWPHQLDNPVWWRSHWIGQSFVLVLSLFGFALVFPASLEDMSPHKWLGYCVLIGVVMQVVLGIFRGSKGGPTARAADGSLRGHHYDMTPWRRRFEALHKAIGYAVLLLAAVTILYGLGNLNAPRWMWAIIILWWSVLIGLFIVFQCRGMAVDTYQAIWGGDEVHPGNQGPEPKWGMHRPGNRKNKEGESDVRRD